MTPSSATTSTTPRPRGAVHLLACVALLVLSVWATDLPDSAKEDVAPSLPRELAKGPTGEPLTEAQLRALESGDVLTHLAAEEGATVKRATAVALVDAAPEAVYAVLLDIARFPAYMAYVEKTEVLGEADGVTRVRFHLDLPWPVGNRHYVLRMEKERTRESEREVLVSSWTYEPGSGNINDTQGYWKVCAYDGKRSFVRYMVLTDPGGKVPPWMADKATAVAVPRVIKSVREEVARAEQP